ncbi:hypothetical protein PIB30_053327 [Stylosanthes scabra]|uniref:Uncharacterized protein n=1 Tax=Stylosanthes scabra TaxID=79078 RepID=A0ABU6QJC7_9FABA|nr:hypothetical protein [Stylosanthes scabra]
MRLGARRAAERRRLQRPEDEMVGRQHFQIIPVIESSVISRVAEAGAVSLCFSSLRGQNFVFHFCRAPRGLDGCSKVHCVRLGAVCGATCDGFVHQCAFAVAVAINWSGQVLFSVVCEQQQGGGLCDYNGI